MIRVSYKRYLQNELSSILQRFAIRNLSYLTKMSTICIFFQKHLDHIMRVCPLALRLMYPVLASHILKEELQQKIVNEAHLKT